MQYCVTCTSIDIQKCVKTEGLVAVYRLQALEGGAKRRCSFCLFLCETLPGEIEHAKRLFRGTGCLYLHMYTDGKEWTRTHSGGLCINEARVYFAQGHWGMNPRLLFGVDGGSGDRIYAQHSYRVLADIDSTAARNNDVIGTYLGNDPRSKNHIAAIQEWLIFCLKNHPDCCKRASGNEHFDARNVPLPSRCLDIKSPHNVKLKETKGERGAYIALSHRWGPETARCRTVVSNYEQRKISVETTVLPQMFQDVIHFSRLLGIENIWIDSLCIIQDGDDGKDWKHEAVLMGKYYQHSLLTIAVTISPDNTEGCFPARASPLTGSLVRLPYRNMQGQQDGFIYLHKRQDSVHNEYRNTILGSGLLKRGWVLQEWLLSRRLIFITPTQLFFECQSQWAQNEYNETAHLGLKLGQISKSTQLEQRVPLKPLFNYNTKPVKDLWYTVVETYSTLNLTKPNLDLIVAIAGIAEEIKQMMVQETDGWDPALKLRNEYVAGLWLRDIHYGLLWEQRTQSSVMASNCGAPTWSWAFNLISVKWQARGMRMQSACRILALTLSDEHTLRLDDDSDQRTTRQQEPVISVEPYSDQDEIRITTSNFGVTNTFACLQIRGQIRPFLVGRYLTSDETSKISECTGRAINFAGLWRAISDPLVPHRHLGWASIEATSVNSQIDDFQSDQCRSSVVLHALHVSTMKGESGGIQFGRLGLTHSVCCLLFMDLVGEDKYHRVGVGRVFQSEYFKGVMEREFQLV